MVPIKRVINVSTHILRPQPSKYCHVQYVLYGRTLASCRFCIILMRPLYFKHILLFTIGATALIDLSKVICLILALRVEGIEDDHFVSKHYTHDRAMD